MEATICACFVKIYKQKTKLYWSPSTAEDAEAYAQSYSYPQLIQEGFSFRRGNMLRHKYLARFLWCLRPNVEDTTHHVLIDRYVCDMLPGNFTY